MTLRFFAGLGALLSPVSGYALEAVAEPAGSVSIAAALCLTLLGLVLFLVMATPGRAEVKVESLFAADQNNERGNNL
jgi:uncharacterized membrane protein